MDSGGNVSACRSNWPSCCTEWGGDGERDPDERQTEVFRQLERPDGVRRPVVGDRRHQCDGVADKQSPPCPALTAAEGGGDDGAAQKAQQDVVPSIHSV